MLEVDNLYAGTEEVTILHGVSLAIDAGEVHALMGPNASGKSTLAKALAGDPGIVVKSGAMRFLGEDLSALTPDERARLGLFLSFQYPPEVPGVTIASFIRTALHELTGEETPVLSYYGQLQEKLKQLELPDGFGARELHVGFSGGEKKRSETLQLAVFAPKLAILDEPDSGLDIDALRIVAESVNAMRSPERAFLIITHYQRILNYIAPDRVHVMVDGRIVHRGGPQLAKELEERGYDWVKREFAGKPSQSEDSQTG